MMLRLFPCCFLTPAFDSTSQFTRQGIQPFPVNVRERERQNGFELQPSVQMALSHMVGIRQGCVCVGGGHVTAPRTSKKDSEGFMTFIKGFKPCDPYNKIIPSTMLI